VTAAQPYWEQPIASVSRPPVPMPATKPKLAFYTPAELAKELRVSKMTVYRLIHDGELDAVQIGRSFRIYVTSVREYLLKRAAGGAA
jgi:excisionase family DNA binding protein